VSDAPFRMVAEVLRVAPSSRRRGNMVAGCFANSRFDLWPMAHLLYSPTSPYRLSNEDLREVFFILTGAYPEEVSDAPDLVDCLASLSESPRTTITTGRVSRIVEDILKEERTNEERAMLLRPLFNRVEKRDMAPLIVRLSHHPTVFRRGEIIAGLTRHSAGQVNRTSMRRAVLLRGLREVCGFASKADWEGILESQQPVNGRGIAVVPPIVKDLAEVQFNKCLFAHPEGEWMTLHIKEGNATLFDSAGTVAEEVSFDQDPPGWFVPLSVLEAGVYLVEYAWGRDIEVMVIDRWAPVGPSERSFSVRRESIPTLIRKPMTPLATSAKVSEFITGKTPVLMWSSFADLSYENTPEEVVLVNGQPNRCIFRVDGGVWAERSLGEGLRLCKWRIAAVDGDDYLVVGTLDAEHDMSKRLTKSCEQSLPVEGEFAPMATPVFVEVDVFGAGWGEIGPYVQGRITRVVGSVGKGDVVRVEQIDLLTDGMEDGEC
jgi:hypothetical protein